MLDIYRTKLEAWKINDTEIEHILNVIETDKKIIIIGPEGSGKTTLLNELIRIKLNYNRYFLYDSATSNTLAPDNQKKVTKNPWGADFLVIDDKPDTTELYFSYPLTILATITVSQQKEYEYLNQKIYPYYDLAIILNAYQSVRDVRKITIHDRLLHRADQHFKLVQEKYDSDHLLPIFIPYTYMRKEWLSGLDIAERAAVQLATMNRSLDTGGLWCWYQKDGEIIQQDLSDLLHYAAVGIENEFEGSMYFQTWLTKVRDEYLPFREDSQNDSMDAKKLEENYWAWKDRKDLFVEVLQLLNDQNIKRSFCNMGKEKFL